MRTKIGHFFYAVSAVVTAVLLGLCVACSDGETEGEKPGDLPQYTVTVTACENGVVTADKNRAREGEEVTLTVTPAEDYELGALSVTQGATPVTVTGNRFTMPAGDVTVSASFKASEIDRAALTGAYPLRISVPKLNNKGDLADDIYIDTEKAADGFNVLMTGFGDLTDGEYIRLVVHTGDVHGSGWALQATDANYMVYKTKAYYKTGVTGLWQWSKPAASGETAASSAPVFTAHAKYFTLTFKVPFAEIPSYTESARVSLFAMEFDDGSIYDGIDYHDGMLINGISSGDPAAQSAYLPIQGYAFCREPALPELVQDYDMEFSMNSGHIYAKAERGATSLKMSFLGFGDYDESGFIRMVVHTDPVDNAGWMLSSSDVSFTIYKDRAFTQTGKIGFFEGAANSFCEQPAIHAPTFTAGDGYWTLTFEIEYFEIGSDVDET